MKPKLPPIEIHGLLPHIDGEITHFTCNRSASENLTLALRPPDGVTVQVVETEITPPLAPSERLRGAETEPLHHAEPLHTLR